MRFILADDKNDDEGRDCSGAGVSEMFEIYRRRPWLGGPRDTSLFTRSEPSKALLPQTATQERHPGSVEVRRCSSGSQIYMRNLGG